MNMDKKIIKSNVANIGYRKRRIDTGLILCIAIAVMLLLVPQAVAWGSHSTKTETDFDSSSELVKIKISPHNAKAHIGESIQYTAQGYDENNNPLSITLAPITFSMAGDTNIGSITPDGYFTALNLGRTKVLATSGSVSAKASAKVERTKQWYEHWYDWLWRHDKEDQEEDNDETGDNSTPVPTRTRTPSPTPTTTPVTTPTPIPTNGGTTQNVNLAGWRSSVYGYQFDSPPCYWVNTAIEMSNKFPGSIPAGVWVIGEIYGSPGSASDTMLTFPKPSGTYPNVKFSGTDQDQNEAYLTAFDNAGMKVFLQVEPADASIPVLIDLILTQYSHHSSVQGMGIDVEWLNERSYPDWGRKVTASEVTAWSNQVKSYNPNYQLFVKHWDETYLGSPVPSVMYIDDSEQNENMNGMISSFKQFANAFPNNEVGFQIGYPSDKSFWSKMIDPAKQIGNEITKTLGNRKVDIYWVDFSIKTPFPPSKYDVCGISVQLQPEQQEQEQLDLFISSVVATETPNTGSDSSNEDQKSPMVRFFERLVSLFYGGREK